MAIHVALCPSRNVNIMSGITIPLSIQLSIGPIEIVMRTEDSHGWLHSENDNIAFGQNFQ